MEKIRTLFIDMYGVIIKESKGYFIPYTFGHFDKTEHNRLEKAFYEDHLFTKAQNGDLSSDTFLSLLGYSDPEETMQDYLNNYLTFDSEFLWFAENNYNNFDFVLLSNDVKEWSKYLFKKYGLHKYFKESIVSGEIHMRKPETGIFRYAINHMQYSPNNCMLIDNSTKNLDTAQKITGINTILFNRDNEAYQGNTVYSFKELDKLLKDT